MNPCYSTYYTWCVRYLTEIDFSNKLDLVWIGVLLDAPILINNCWIIYTARRHTFTVIYDHWNYGLLKYTDGRSKERKAAGARKKWTYKKKRCFSLWDSSCRILARLIVSKSEYISLNNIHCIFCSGF